MGESESVSYHGAVFQGAEFYGELVFGAELGTADFEGAEVAVGGGRVISWMAGSFYFGLRGEGGEGVGWIK